MALEMQTHTSEGESWRGAWAVWPRTHVLTLTFMSIKKHKHTRTQVQTLHRWEWAGT